MSEYAKSIQTIEDLWKKRIELPKLTEVVRCRDCAYRGWSDAGGHFCARGIGLTVEPDGFCAWAERREP